MNEALNLTLGARCPKCYSDDWIPNGYVHHYEKELEENEPDEAEMLVPVSTTRHYRYSHCGYFITGEVPFHPEREL